MRRVFRSPWPLLAAGVSIVVAACSVMPGSDSGRPGFFVTSTGLGKGADLGGIAGADRHCQALAAAVPNGANRTWRAYLSTQEDAERQRARPHRQGPLVQREGPAHRPRHGRAPRCEEQRDEADGADREGRGRAGARRHAEPPRHHDRFARRRNRLLAERSRHDLRQLDAQRQRGRGDSPAITTAWGRTPTRGRCHGTPRTGRVRGAARKR